MLQRVVTPKDRITGRLLLPATGTYGDVDGDSLTISLHPTFLLSSPFMWHHFLLPIKWIDTNNRFNDMSTTNVYVTKIAKDACF